jgi:hypothetical protein
MELLGFLLYVALLVVLFMMDVKLMVPFWPNADDVHIIFRVRKSGRLGGMVGYGVADSSGTVGSEIRSKVGFGSTYNIQQ